MEFTKRIIVKSGRPSCLDEHETFQKPTYQGFHNLEEEIKKTITRSKQSLKVAGDAACLKEKAHVYRRTLNLVHEKDFPNLTKMGEEIRNLADYAYAHCATDLRHIRSDLENVEANINDILEIIQVAQAYIKACKRRTLETESMLENMKNEFKISGLSIEKPADPLMHLGPLYQRSMDLLSNITRLKEYLEVSQNCKQLRSLEEEINHYFMNKEELEKLELEKKELNKLFEFYNSELLDFACICGKYKSELEEMKDARHNFSTTPRNSKKESTQLMKNHQAEVYNTKIATIVTPKHPGA